MTVKVIRREHRLHWRRDGERDVWPPSDPRPVHQKQFEIPALSAENGRSDEADRIVAGIEREANRTDSPPPYSNPSAAAARVVPRYIAGIVDLIWFACYFVGYGLTGWLPAIYSRVFHLNLGTSLRYGLLTSVAGVLGAVICGLLIDRIGRRTWFAAAFIAAAATLQLLALLRPTNAQTAMSRPCGRNGPSLDFLNEIGIPKTEKL